MGGRLKPHLTSTAPIVEQTGSCTVLLSQGVCQKVLADMSQGPEVRQRRMEALQTLGNILMAAKSQSEDAKDFMKVMEEAVRMAATKEDQPNQ